MKTVGASLLTWLVILFAAPQLAPASETTWQTVAPGDFLFTALMPDPTTVESFQSSSILGQTRSKIYHSQTGSTRFSVSVTEIPRAAAWLAPLRIVFGQARSRLLESTHGTEESFRRTERKGLEGRQLLFNTAPPDEGPREARAEFFFIDGRLLVIEASHPLHSSNVAVERFFSSLQLDRQECRRSQDGTPAEECRVDLALD